MIPTVDLEKFTRISNVSKIELTTVATENYWSSSSIILSQLQSDTNFQAKSKIEEQFLVDLVQAQIMHSINMLKNLHMKPPNSWIFECREGNRSFERKKHMC